MFIRKLQIQNFRSHTDTTLELDRVTVVRGANSSGKSSIEQALEIALAGRAEGTTADGKGSYGLIRAGETKARIKLGLINDPNEPTSERIVECVLNKTSRDVQITNPFDQNWAGEATVLNWLKGKRELLSCLINNRYFVDLLEDKQKDILSAIVLPEKYEWPAWVIPSVNSLKIKVDWTRTPFEVIQEAYAGAFEARTGITRELKNCKVPAGETAQAEMVADLEQSLKNQRAELEGLTTAKAAKLAGGNGNVEAQRTAIQKRLIDAQNRIARDNQAVTLADRALLSKAQMKTHQENVKKADRAKELDKAMIQHSAQQKLNDDAFAELNKLSNESNCPTCKRPMDEGTIDHILETLTARRNTLSTQYDAAVEERKAIGDVDAATRLLALHEQAQKDMTAAKDRIKEDERIVREAQSELDKLPTTEAVDTSADDAHIAQVREAIANDEKTLGRARQQKALLDEQTKAKARLADLQKQSQEVERLVIYFRDEVKNELLTEGLGEFTAQMNDVLSQWGYTAQISIDPYIFAILFKDSQGTKPIQLKHLSKSQRYRFAVAFQVALAIQSGFRFVVVDEADIYDTSGRQALFTILNSEELDQAIVLATDERDKVPSVQGAVFYRFADVSEDAAGLPTTEAQQLVPEA